MNEYLTKIFELLKDTKLYSVLERITKALADVLDWIVFQYNSYLNTYNWRRMIRRAHRWKRKYKREFFVIPISKTRLGVTDGRYPLNKKWLVKLRGKDKRLKYSRLIKLSYYNTLFKNKPDFKYTYNYDYHTQNKR